MRSGAVVSVALLLMLAGSALAQEKGPILYQVIPEDRAHWFNRERQGKPTLHVTLQFRINHADGRPATDIGKDEIVVEEDRRRVAELEVYQPRALDPLTVILALDISGSMANQGKLEEAKQAANVFLDLLHDRADAGLILFDHEVRLTVPPAGDARRYREQRDRLRQQIRAARPAGGTAYLDATARALALLRGVSGRKAIVVMTDGVDLHSRQTLAEVIALAQEVRVPIYTLGIGEVGKWEPVTTVLVLDHSGSMSAPADDKSQVPKIEAMQRAAGRFVELMRPRAQTTLLPFSSDVQPPRAFSADKSVLKQRIAGLKPDGETALFDAVHAAVRSLEAARPEGKRAVVALTDGIDNCSRRRVEEVVDTARAAGVPLHVMGLGQPGDLDSKVMERMARETGGEYHHADDDEKLYHIFENLSIQLHDDGIDQEALTRLATETGGKFHHVRRITDLRLAYQGLAEELQNTYTVTFPSQRPTHDGTSRGITIRVVRQGVGMSEAASLDYHVHGVVVPKMSPTVYLACLVMLVGLLALPTGLRRLYRFSGGT